MKVPPRQTAKTRNHPPRIIALGGGGFSMEPDNPLLDNFILGLAGKRKPRVCFVPTASGDSPVYVEKFRAAFPPARARATHLPLFQRDATDPAEHLLGQDVIYVGGGNTANALAVWRVHGVDAALRRAWRSGVVLCGISAGMICWFQSCLTDSFGPLSPLRDGLGLLKGSATPHYDGEPGRRPAYHAAVASGRLPPGYAADDGAALYFVGTRLKEAVCSRPNARAYFVRKVGRRAVEEALPTRFLGESPLPAMRHAGS